MTARMFDRTDPATAQAIKAADYTRSMDAHDREQTRTRDHPDLAGVVLCDKQAPPGTITQHNRPDGTPCLWAGCRTIEPHCWCPDRCQMHTT